MRNRWTEARLRRRGGLNEYSQAPGLKSLELREYKEGPP